MNLKEALLILGLSENITIEQLKKKYRKLVLDNHPDRHEGKTKQLTQINLANELLLKHLQNRALIPQQNIYPYTTIFTFNVSQHDPTSQGTTTHWYSHY